MKRAIVSLALLFLTAAAAHGQSRPMSVLGLWMTEGGKSRVQVYPCGAKVCGRIVWLREPNDVAGLPKVDGKNPKPDMRKRRIVGTMILWDLVKGDDPGEWESGRIYNPEDGETYRVKLTLRPDGKLRVRGYLGISLLGKTQFWERTR